MKLYEITKEFKELETIAESGGPDMEQAISDTFESIEGEFNEKAVSLIHVVHNMDSDVDAIDAEIKRLQAHKQTLTNRRDSLRNYLQTNMEASGISKIECPLFTITLRKGRDIVFISDVDKIPTDYIDFKTSSSPMKKEILAALKNGESIPGCELTKSKQALTIK